MQSLLLPFLRKQAEVSALLVAAAMLEKPETLVLADKMATGYVMAPALQRNGTEEVEVIQNLVR